MNELYKHYTLLEKRILLNSQHPFLNTLKWSFQSNDMLFYVMELCKGGGLKAITKKQGLNNV